MFMAVGLVVAVVPAVFGLADNPSLSHRVAIRIPAGAIMLTASQIDSAIRVGHGTAPSGIGGQAPSGIGGQATPGTSGTSGQAAPGTSGTSGQAPSGTSGRGGTPGISGKDGQASSTPGISGKDGQATPTTPGTSGKGGHSTPTTTPSPDKGGNPASIPGTSVSGPVATRGGSSSGK
jgi:hypothetical protein